MRLPEHFWDIIWYTLAGAVGFFFLAISLGAVALIIAAATQHWEIK
jgi:hypothetical protein